MRSMSPTWTSRAGLASISLERMRPRSQALEARARVLKKRAAQSHLSMRTKDLPWPAVKGTRRNSSGRIAGSFPDVEVFGVAGGGYLHASLMSGTIESRADIFLTVGQCRERNSESEIRFQLFEVAQNLGNDFFVFAF